MTPRPAPRPTPFIAVALLSLLFGCDVPPRGAGTAGWQERWPALARSGPRLRAGAELHLVTWEGGPAGPRARRERWTLLRRDSLSGEFEVELEGARPRLEQRRLHPAVPAVPFVGGGRIGRGRCPVEGPLQPVVVPAGRFRCAHTWRSREEHDGRVMRVDEWWTPGVPVPVQRWTRAEEVAETLRTPPRRVADLPAGTEWAVLERIRRP